MTCPQCNAVLPESATFCHSCGSPIRSVSFSYLPSGTPAWPSTIPQRPLASAGATAQAGQEKISPTKPLPSRPKRSARSIFIITALFILIPLVGIGATLGTLWFNGEIPVKTVNSSIPRAACSNTASPDTADAWYLNRNAYNSCADKSIAHPRIVSNSNSRRALAPP